MDGNGQAAITGADIDGGSTDNCSINSFTVSPNSFDNTDLGDNNVFLTVFDDSGNAATCNATVNVTAIANPTITCPSDVTVTAGTGDCDATVTVDIPAISNSIQTNAAMNFDGTNDYLSINSISGFSTGTNARTFEAWIRMTSTGSTVTVFEYGSPFGSNARWMVRIDGGGGLFLDLNGTIKSWSTDLDDGEWHHIAVTHDGTSTLLGTNAYVDGVIVSPIINPFTSFSTSNVSTVAVGTIAPDFNDYFQGDIDEVRFWSDRRTAFEISTNLDNELSGFEANLILYFNFIRETHVRAIPVLLLQIWPEEIIMVHCQASTT